MAKSENHQEANDPVEEGEQETNLLDEQSELIAVLMMFKLVKLSLKSQISVTSLFHYLPDTYT